MFGLNLLSYAVCSKSFWGIDQPSNRNQMNEGLSAGVVNATTLADLYGVLVAQSMMWIAGKGQLTDEHQVCFVLSSFAARARSLSISPSLPLSVSL